MRARVFPTEFVFARLLLPSMAGMLAAHMHLLDSTLSLRLALLLFSAMILCAGNFLRFRFDKLKYLAGLLCAATALFAGASSYLLADERQASDHFSKFNTDTYRVLIDHEPRIAGKVLTVNARVTAVYVNRKSFPASGNLQVTLLPSAVRPVYGDVLIIRGRRQETAGPQNPAQFNYRNWLASKNIYHQVVAQHVRTIARGCGNQLKMFAFAIRNHCTSVINRTIKDRQARAVAATLLLGSRTDISADVLAAYADTGTIHALSVSGMHLALVYIVLEKLLQLVRWKWFRRWVKPVVAALLIWLYALMTGFSASVMRAAAMISVFIAAGAAGRNTNAYNTLAFAAFLLLNINPLLLTDVGFQLSFCSVLGLIALQRPIYYLVSFDNYPANEIWKLCATSVAAQAATLPLSVYYFHQFPVLFLPANLFVGLPVALVMYLGMALLLFQADFLGIWIEWLIMLMNSGLQWLSRLPAATIEQIWLSPIQLAALTGFLMAFGFAFSARNRLLLYCGTGLLLCLELALCLDQQQSTRQRMVIFYSLRSGYATAFISGKTALIFTDLDNNEKTYQMQVKPGLDSLKVSHVALRKLSPGCHSLRFQNQRILVFQGKGLCIPDPKATIIWCHQLRTSMPFEPPERVKLVVADASCSKIALAGLSATASVFQTAFRSLREGPAVVIDLNRSAQ